jgi:hypothetical protein
VYNGSSTVPWSSTEKLTTEPSIDRTPSITVTADGNIWVVWSSNRDDPNYEIYYKVYNESSWSLDTRLTENAGVDEFPSIMQDKDGDVWVVWSSDRTGNFEIYYKIYNYTKKEWLPEELLISHPAVDSDPSIMQAQDGRIWVAWIRDNNLFYKVLFENKTEVVPDTKLTDNEINRYPSIMQAQDGKVWVAWESYRPEMSSGLDIYCKTFYNGSWSEERITYNSVDDFMPAIMQAADGKIWITWVSNRLDNFDIYYKTDSPPEHLHDIAVISVTHNPNVTYQGLVVYIEAVPQNQGLEGEYIRVDYYANSTLIESETLHLSAGQLIPLDFRWNTSNVPPGTYTIIVNASITGEIDADLADNTFIDGKVYVKIPGDVNGDGIVDASDLFDLSKAYGSVPGDSNWNPGCDFNGDNEVYASDLFDLIENYGGTV